MLPILLWVAAINGSNGAPLTASEVVDRMVRADEERRSTLAGYTGMRRYHFENKKVDKRADMTVRMTCDAAGVKSFEVLNESGSGTIRNRILRKMLEAEHEASQKGERDQARIIPANYEFSLAADAVLDGRPSYVLDVTPKSASKFLIRGRIWVDAEDFAITRVEGQPAKNPSFWIRSVHVTQKYGRTGQFWLPVMNVSKAEARIFGRTDVSIEYFDYVTSVREARVERAERSRP